jgi:hypothetical protein
VEVVEVVEVVAAAAVAAVAGRTPAEPWYPERHEGSLSMDRDPSSFHSSG